MFPRPGWLHPNARLLKVDSLPVQFTFSSTALPLVIPNAPSKNGVATVGKNGISLSIV